MPHSEPKPQAAAQAPKADPNRLGDQATRRSSDESKLLLRYAKVFLAPTLLSKSFILYFGLHYSERPGEGYGWGLAAAIAATLANFAAFIWLAWKDEPHA